MKLLIKKGTTSQTALVFIQDSSSTTGAGLTGLAWNTSGLTWHYYREGAGTGATAVTLATQTLGTWSTGGFIVVDATNMPGWYELGIPNAVLASGADFVGMVLKGATNMAQLNIEIQLTDLDVNDGVRGGMTALPNAAADAAGGLPISDAGGLDLDAKVGALTFTTANKVDCRVDNWAGTAVTISATSAKPEVDIASIHDDATAASQCEAFFDNAGFNASNSTIGTVTTATGVTLSDTTHGGASAVLNLERLVINSTTLNQPGILITGDGAGAGISTTGGSTGQGILSKGGSSSGEGIKATGGVGGGTGFSAVGTGSGHGINASNTTGTGNGMNLDTSGSGAGNAFQTSVAGSNEHFTPFNTAIPGAPTADSIYERIAAIDDLTQSGGSGDLEAILTDTGTDGVVVSADGFTDIWATTTLTEAYATDGAAATPAQLMYMIWAALSEFSISGTTITAKKLDGSTTAMTFTLDDASDPTSRTRAT